MRDKQSIDGFIPRRRSDNRLSGGRKKKSNSTLTDTGSRLLHNSEKSDRDISKPQKEAYNVVRSDISESLRGIDSDESAPKKLSRRQKRKSSKKKRSLKSKMIRSAIALIAIALIGIGSYALYKVVNASHSAFKGNIFDVFKSQALKQDSNGRSNFLVLGTSEDDNGHDGADLTDSMLVVSVDQKNKDIYMFSIPRDLYVKYGMACASGYSGKINAYFSCVDSGTNSEAEQSRLKKTQSFVGEILGIDIQYGVHVNHTVIKQAVNAVGGVDVDIEGSNGDPGVLDRNFDWRCNYTCYLVKYENGVHHLDGEHALYLSMARGDIAPTYGLGNSNFDREKNQQKILMALKAKATSTGTLTNLSVITGLIDALGDNLRTNIETGEIRTLADVANGVKQADVHTISLFGSDGDSVVTTGNYGGASVVMPSAGIYDYSDIKALIAKNLTNNPVAKEAAPIVVLNGTGQTGYGKIKADALASEGYNISSISNAPDGTYDKVEVYQIGTGNSATASKLASKYKVTIKKAAPPVEVANAVKFVIIFGSTED